MQASADWKGDGRHLQGLYNDAWGFMKGALQDRKIASQLEDWSTHWNLMEHGGTAPTCQQDKNIMKLRDDAAIALREQDGNIDNPDPLVAFMCCARLFGIDAGNYHENPPQPDVLRKLNHSSLALLSAS